METLYYDSIRMCNRLNFVSMNRGKRVEVARHCLKREENTDGARAATPPPNPPITVTVLCKERVARYCLKREENTGGAPAATPPPNPLMTVTVLYKNNPYTLPLPLVRRCSSGAPLQSRIPPLYIKGCS